MSRFVFQFLALAAASASLCGCPLINPLLAAPESSFEASPTSGQAPLTVLFADTSDAGTTNITDWQWDFGDGNTSTLRNPSHIYEMPGLYSVSLTVTTSVDTHTVLRREFINVVQPPAAEFEAAPVLGNAPLEVAFTDLSEAGSAEITDWQWNFGDRTPTSAEQNPVHIYDEPGLYTVSLAVTTAVDSDTVEKTQYINVAGNPVADFETDFEPGTAPLTVNFTDTSDAGTADVTGWMWDFGDGGMSMEQNPTHTYETPGVYTVSLTIETGVGEDMVVREGLIDVGEGPTAMFSGEPVMGSAPLSVTFTDESSAGSMAISKWLWDFGDGGLLSTRQNPTRVYNVPGVYTVSLRVTTPVGENTLEQPEYITVLPGVTFTGNRTSGEGSLTVQFIDQSPVGDFEISAWAWDFGDGGMSTERNPEHTYAEPGVYDVSLTITTELGDSTATEAGYVTVAPTTAFSADPTSGPPPLEVAFSDETAAGAFEISAWAWDFGDGGTSDEQSPMHTYDTPGVYTVELATTTENGSASETKGGLIRVEPVVGFGASATEGQGSLTVDFEDQTDAGNLNILAWFWDFGDGMTGTGQNPTHTYQNIGTYTVSLRVTTALGDTTTTEMDYIKVGPEVDFSSDVTAGVGTLAVQFTDAIEAGSLDVEGLLWEFGDGNTSDMANPMHEYAMPGIYTVALTVTTAQGDTTTTKPDLIMVEPEVAIDNVQAEGPAPFEASLLDVTAPLPDGNPFKITAWEWSLGDGNTSTEQNPVHVYEDPGTYTVSLTVTTESGDQFSVTEPDFIRSLAGPTAVFSEVITPGGDPDDPVTVSFINDSTSGDAPMILNQTWDFGASAIFAEEDTEEANPTVTYPGPAFATVPQDVSLTVRTEIAEDTLLKENIFNAPTAKSNLTPEMLWETEITALAVNSRGEDVWVAGVLPSDERTMDDVVVGRLSPQGTIRWAHRLTPDAPLQIAGMAVSDEDFLVVSGTLEGADSATGYLAGYDGAGALRWETLLHGAPIRAPGAVAWLTSDTFLVTCTNGAAANSRTLSFSRGDLQGRVSPPRDAGIRVMPGPMTMTVVGGNEWLLADASGALWVAEMVNDGVSVAEWAGPDTPVGALAWDASQNVLHRTGQQDGAWGLQSGSQRLALPEAVSDLHAIRLSARDSTGSVVWLARDDKAQRWQVRQVVFVR